METPQVISALAGLAQESRLAAYRVLVQAGSEGMAASRICQHIGAAPSALSFHLKEMLHAGLVNSRQQGRFVIYSANYDTMNGVIAYLTDNCCGGQPCGPAVKTAEDKCC